MSMEFIGIEEPEESDAPVIRTTERSVPRYPTAHGVDGRPWRDVFASAKKASDPDDDEEPEEVEVIERGYDLQEPLSAPGAAGTLARRLHVGGWTVRVRKSRVRVPATLYKSASEEGSAAQYSAGDIRFAAHELETTVVIAFKRAPTGEIGFALEATWFSKGGFQGARTFDPVLGEEWRTTSLKPRKPRAWEAEDGDIEGPWGLDQWLSAVCPKPVKKTTQKKEAA